MASTTIAADVGAADQEQVEEERHAEQPDEADQVGQGEDPVCRGGLVAGVTAGALPEPADATPNLPPQHGSGTRDRARRRVVRVAGPAAPAPL